MNCVDCKKDFEISEKTKRGFVARGWELPKRCRDCQEVAKRKRNSPFFKMYRLLNIKERSDYSHNLRTTTMAKYKALEAFTINGVDNEIGAEVELSESEAAELGAKVELLVEGTPEEALDEAAEPEEPKEEVPA